MVLFLKTNKKIFCIRDRELLTHPVLKKALDKNELSKSISSRDKSYSDSKLMITLPLVLLPV